MVKHGTSKTQLTFIFILIPIIFLALLAVLPGCVMRSDLFGSHLLADLEIRQGPNYISDGDGVFDFGDTGLFSSVSYVFTIENRGNGPLALLGISSLNEPVPQYHIDTSTLSTTLYAGQSTAFTITFKPTYLGYKPAIVKIESDDPDGTFTFTIVGNGVASTMEPDISLKQGISNIPTGSGSYDFGTQGVGSSSSPVTFTIDNGGDADLSVSDISFTSGDSSQFSIIAPTIPGSIAPGSTATFTVTFAPNSSGNKAATIELMNDDPDENPYYFTVQGYGSPIPEPDIHVRQGATDLFDGSGSYGFVSVQEGFSSSPVTFTIENNGTLDLTVNDAALSAGDVSDFSLDQSALPAVLTPSSSVTITITFSPLTAGTKSATVRIDNDDPDENPYTFTVEGYGQPTPVPEINIRKGGSTIPDGGFAHDFGNVEEYTSSAPVTFTIENLGTSDLTISDGYSDNGEFTINGPAVPFTVTAGSSRDFTVTFEPQPPSGAKAANIFIVNDDADEGSYTIGMSGTADPAPIPDMHVKQGSTDLPDGSGNFYFGHVLAGNSSPPVFFTIENSGTGDLNILSAASSDPARFIIADLTVSLIPQGSSTTFSITYAPGSVGSHSATITIDNDDPDENPYTFTVTGDGDASGSADINLKQNTTVLADGSGTYDYQNVLVGTASNVEFTIVNEGSADLTVSSVYLSGGDTDQFSIDLSQLSSIVSSVVPSNTTKFYIDFIPTQTGNITATVTIQNSDSDENPYTFTVTGYGDPAPIADINLKRGSTTYPDGATYNFGQVGGSSTRTFTVENLGTADLHINNILLMEGDLDYTLDLTGTAFTITPGGSTTFMITFDPQGGGTRWRNLVINSDDLNESPYNIRLEGMLD